MTVAAPALDDLEPAPDDLAAGLPDAEHVFAPTSLEEAARILAAASAREAAVLVWGGGTHQGIGYPVDADVVVSTARLDRLVAWEPDDLTLVVEAGVPVADVEARLAEAGQTAGLPETPGDATVGGVVAAGISGYRRARYGPTRDRMLEVTLLTGDGRQVRGGGRVVKNVTGYDLPRLATGSLGSLGLIGEVCLKLWPLPEARATVAVSDPAAAWRALHQPLAVLETRRGAWAFLQGVPADVEAQAERVGELVSDRLDWPDPPAGEVTVSLRVPPSRTAAAVGRVPPRWELVAQHGVGEVTAALPEDDVGLVDDLRGWAEAAGGSLVVTHLPERLQGAVDPWGSPPPALDLQRRLVSAFDPFRILNPGRLPGGI